MKIRDLPRVTAQQVASGQRLGLDLTGDTVGVAWARISDVMQREFWGRQDLGSPTKKQIAFAKGFGVDISALSRAVANAIVDDIMTQLNFDAIRQGGLAPGVKVRRTHDPMKQAHIISSIHENGTVFFKGGNGQRAWARNVERI